MVETAKSIVSLGVAAAVAPVFVLGLFLVVHGDGWYLAAKYLFR